MNQLLLRDSVCVKSEQSLLGFVLSWAELNVASIEDYPYLAKLASHIYAERKGVLSRISKNFPRFDVSLVTPPAARGKLRHCSQGFYLVEFKLSRNQLRNIEDFVDTGEKSSFYSFSLTKATYSQVAELTNTGSMCGTSNGNYFRPITKVSCLDYPTWDNQDTALRLHGLSEFFKSYLRPKWVSYIRRYLYDTDIHYIYRRY